jgi:hypothetical protein
MVTVRLTYTNSAGFLNGFTEPGLVVVEMDDDEGVLRAWILLALHDGALNCLIGPRALLMPPSCSRLIVRACGYRSFSLLYEAWNEEQGRSQLERWR